MMLAFLPVYLYLIGRAWQMNTWSYWFLATLVALMGLNYHEFFVFIFLVHVIISGYTFFYKFYLKSRETKDRAIFLLSCAVAVLLVVNIGTRIGLLRITFNLAHSAMTRLLSSHVWHWWFLSGYNTDGEQFQV